AGDAVATDDVLGGLDHAADRTEPPFRLGTLPAPIKAVVEGHVARAPAPPQIGRVVLDVAHALHAARDDHVGVAGLHHHRGGGHRLQPAPAPSVGLQTRDLDG